MRGLKLTTRLSSEIPKINYQCVASRHNQWDNSLTLRFIAWCYWWWPSLALKGYVTYCVETAQGKKRQKKLTYFQKRWDGPFFAKQEACAMYLLRSPRMDMERKILCSRGLHLNVDWGEHSVCAWNSMCERIDVNLEVLDPGTGIQWLRTLFLLLGLLLSYFPFPKTFPFHNRSSLNFAYRLVTILSTIVPCPNWLIMIIHSCSARSLWK